MQKNLLALTLAILMAAPAHAGTLDKAKTVGATSLKTIKRVVLFIPRLVYFQSQHLGLDVHYAWYADELMEAH